MNISFPHTFQWLRALIIILLFTNKFSRESTEVDNQVWMNYYSYRIPKKDLQFVGDTGIRFLTGSGWQKFTLRPSL